LGGTISDEHGPIGKIPLRGRLRLIRESFRYVPPEKGDEFRYRDILYFTRYLLPLRWAVLASLILTFITSVLATALPLSGKWIIDYIFMKESIQPVLDSFTAHHLGFLVPAATAVLTSLPLLIATLAGISAARYLIGNELSLINYRINTEYAYRVKMAVFSRVIRYPISYFRSTRSGYLLARISSDTGALSGISGNFLQSIITSGTSLCVSATVLTSLSLPLTMFVILTVPVTVGISYGVLAYNRSFSLRMRESGLQVAADGQDLFGSIDLVKTHAAEERELNRYMRRNLDNISLNVASMLFGQATGGVQQAFSAIIRLVVMLYGGNLVLAGEMSIGSYMAFLAMYPQLTGAISSFLQMPLSLQWPAIAAGRVKELLLMTTEYEHDNPDKTLLVPEIRATGHIRCEHVSFAYEAGTPVLTDLSLDIRTGDRVGIVGPTGAGKTTFISLLLKFYRPQEGRIILDGYDYADLNPAWIRNQVAVVSQDLMIFHDTIMNNIRYSRPEAPDEEVIAAARSAGIHDEIIGFAEGYETIAGEKGSTLSGGQKQRIAIARALLRDAPIVILDEPTAHLDQETEELLVQEFLRICHDRTMIVITHRESLLRLVSRVYRVKDGRMGEIVGGQRIS
jgi:subfamily B ATP-binding cassette protein MsbA